MNDPLDSLGELAALLGLFMVGSLVLLAVGGVVVGLILTVLGIATPG